MSTSYRETQHHLLEAFPDEIFRPQEVAEWTGPFELPPEIQDYFQQLGPVDVTIEGHGNPYFLPSLSSLWSFQGGYRYDVSSGEPFPDWNPDWLVVADEGGDPYIFSLSSKNILYAHHGEGSWDPTPLFDNLCDMASCFAILGHIVAKNREQLTDDDCLILPQHIESARNQMVSPLGAEAKADLILDTLGWSR